MFCGYVTWQQVSEAQLIKSSEALTAIAYFIFAFYSPFVVRSTTVIWSSWPEHSGVDNAFIGKESHRDMSQVRPSTQNHLSGKAWDLNAGQMLKHSGSALKQQPWQLPSPESSCLRMDRI